jgi:hypothetical protein
MRRARKAVCLTAAGLVLVLAGCGESDPTEGLVSNVDKARNAASLAGLQTGLVTVALVEAAAPGGTAQDIAAGLQAKDPTNRYTTSPPTAAGIIQVLGGGGSPVMLVSINSSPSSGREPYFVAAWQGGGTTMYYAGHQPPAYSPGAPAGAGWSQTLPQ